MRFITAVRKEGKNVLVITIPTVFAKAQDIQSQDILELEITTKIRKTEENKNE